MSERPPLLKIVLIAVVVGVPVGLQRADADTRATWAVGAAFLVGAVLAGGAGYAAWRGWRRYGWPWAQRAGFTIPMLLIVALLALLLIRLW